MAKSETEAMYLEWLKQRFDPEDEEQLAAFRAWLERGANDPKRCVTVAEVLAVWQKLIQRRKMH